MPRTTDVSVPKSRTPHSITRRAFVRTSALGLTALSAGRVLGANERIGVGLIGFGLIGRIHTRSFLAQPDVDVVGLSETDQPRMEAGAALIGGNVKKYPDFRRMHENKDVDAAVVATPDHWHALQTMLACAAGKDVYVEKPLTLFVNEGRWMLDVAQRYKRVVQVGTQNLILRFLESLRRNPDAKGDYEEKDEMGRPVQIKVIGK